MCSSWCKRWLAAALTRDAAAGRCCRLLLLLLLLASLLHGPADGHMKNTHVQLWMMTDNKSNHNASWQKQQETAGSRLMTIDTQR